MVKTRRVQNVQHITQNLMASLMDVDFILNRYRTILIERGCSAPRV